MVCSNVEIWGGQEKGVLRAKREGFNAVRDSERERWWRDSEMGGKGGGGDDLEWEERGKDMELLVTGRNWRGKVIVNNIREREGHVKQGGG